MSYKVCNFYGVCHVITNFNKRFIILLCNICMLHLYAIFMKLILSFAHVIRLSFMTHLIKTLFN